MALGMTYDDYWYGDVFKARAFLQADIERQKRTNETAWLFGAYVYNALNATVGNLFMDKNDEPNRYPSEPISFDEKQSEEKKLKEQEAERNRLVAYLNAVALNRRNNS